MKNEIFSLICGVLIFTSLFVACDDGKIYEEKHHTEREGGTIRLTAKIDGIDSWPGGYSVVLAGFAPDNAFAQTAKGITPMADGTIDMVLAGIPAEVNQIEICVINKLRKRIASFYMAEYEQQTDTTQLEVGNLDVSMFNSIQQTVFDAHCIACHGTSTSAAGGLYLTEGRSYDALVNVKADLSPEGKMLVHPGEPDDSFILDILLSNTTRHDHSDILSVMPEKTTLLQSWIEGGAKK